MEDKKIDDLLSSYSENLGHFDGSVPKSAQRHINLWKPIVITIMGGAILTAFVVLPRKAEAAPIEKVIMALKDTKFWMATTTTRANGGKWGPYSSSINKDGKIWFRTEVFGGASKQITTLFDGGFEYDEWSELPYVLKSKFNPDPRMNVSAMTDPLKNALSRVGGMRSDFVRTDGIKYNGQQVYSLSLTPKRNKATKSSLKEFELIVQRDTNLPLVSTINGSIPGTKNRQEIKTVYGYDVTQNRQPMIPNPNKALIDADAEKKRLVEQWAMKIEGTQLPTILEASITPDGTIWIAYVSEGNQNNYVSPKELGEKGYVQGVTYSLSDWKAAAAPRVTGKDVLVSTFIALNPKPSPKTSVFVKWNNRPGTRPHDPTTCPLVGEKWDFPSYFPPFMGEFNVDLYKNSMLNTRGDALRVKTDYKSAAEAYMKRYEIMKRNRYAVNAHKSSLLAAAECYEKLGDIAMAKKLRKLIPTSARTKS